MHLTLLLAILAYADSISSQSDELSSCAYDYSGMFTCLGPMADRLITVATAYGQDLARDVVSVSTILYKHYHPLSGGFHGDSSNTTHFELKIDVYSNGIKIDSAPVGKLLMGLAYLVVIGLVFNVSIRTMCNTLIAPLCATAITSLAMLSSVIGMLYCMRRVALVHRLLEQQ